MNKGTQNIDESQTNNKLVFYRKAVQELDALNKKKIVLQVYFSKNVCTKWPISNIIMYVRCPFDARPFFCFRKSAVTSRITRAVCRFIWSEGIFTTSRNVSVQVKLFNTINLDMERSTGWRLSSNLEQNTFTSFLRFWRLQGSQDCLIKHIL